MKTGHSFAIMMLLVLASPFETLAQPKDFEAQTLVTIEDEKWYINGEPTLKGRKWLGYNVEGLLPNARLVQGIYDDLNPETESRWKYPDTGKWDADRNTREFVSAMDEWADHGLLAFTLNLQGGSPQGYSKEQPWHNSAIGERGGLREDYMNRLSLIIEKADRLGMVVILGIFYFGQDERLKDESAVIDAVDNTAEWLLDKKYKNVVIEVANECDNRKYDHEILRPGRIVELIERIKQHARDDHRLLVGTSFNGGSIPGDAVIEASDFILIHGNGVKDPSGINNMANTTRNKKSYSPKPIVNNEDDHFDFDKPMNNFIASTSVYVSWGFFDYRKEGEGFAEGYQSVPVEWGINSERKKGFFELVAAMTGRR